MHFQKINFLISIIIFVLSSTIFANQTVDDAEVWNFQKEYTKGDIVEHGDFEGTPMYWTSKWWPMGVEPGGIADSGMESPWELINSKSFGEGKEYEWVGWNSNAGKWEYTHNNNMIFKPTQIGDWGEQIDVKGTGAYLPTYRDGAEGMYTIIHEHLGELDYDWAIHPGNEVGYEHPRIRVGWAAKPFYIQDTEWRLLRDMVMDGHEILNHSYTNNSVYDLWKWFYHGDTLNNNDFSIPKEIRNLVVDSTVTSWKSIEVKIPTVDYIDGDLNKAETTYATVFYQVSNNYEYKVDSTFDEFLEEWKYEYVSTGNIKPEHKGWSDEAQANVNLLKLFCLPGWTSSAFKANINGTNNLINRNIYEWITPPRFAKDKRCEYFVYPFDYSYEALNDSLRSYGIIGACGGEKRGYQTSGDFYHPFHINFDNFNMIDGNASLIYPDNPIQRVSLDGMLEQIYRTKGYMIRKFCGVVDVDDWQNINLNFVSEGTIPKSLYKKHYEKIDQLIDEHKITVMTPSEAVKYRLTANSVSGASLQDSYWNGKLSVVASGCPEEYQDEISIIVKLSEAQDQLRVRYASGENPRYLPRKMDDSGKAWSVSINPYKEGGVLHFYHSLHIGSIDFGDRLKKGFINYINKKQISLKLPQGDFNFKIYNISGKIIINKVIKGDNNIKEICFNKELAQGNYIIKISDGLNSFKRKILIK